MSPLLDDAVLRSTVAVSLVADALALVAGDSLAGAAAVVVVVVPDPPPHAVSEAARAITARPTLSCFFMCCSLARAGRLGDRRYLE
jgi:hypothetical protein